MTTQPPLRILVAPSGFKECLDADQVASAIAAGVHRALPDAAVATMPLVDGGEGSAAALARATGGQLRPVTVTGPVGQSVASHFALLGGAGPPTAVVEIAAAAGLRLVPRDQRDPTRTTSYGVGQLITAALDAGVEKILICCGDSGISDGGAGMLTALGARLLDEHGDLVGPGGAELARIVKLDLTGLDARLAHVDLLVATNPHNLLCGPRGVARVFGPQKGATAEQVELLDHALTHWAAILADTTGLELSSIPGGGASGGLGAGLAAVGGRLLPRFDVLLDHIDLDSAIADADLIITAEGAIDAQTPLAKVPAEVARRAEPYGTPVVVLAGTIGAGAHLCYQTGIDAYASIQPCPVDLAEAMNRATEFITNATERILRLITVGTRLSQVDPRSPRRCSRPSSVCSRSRSSAAYKRTLWPSLRPLPPWRWQ